MNLTETCTDQMINVTRTCVNGLSAMQTDFVWAAICLILFLMMGRLFYVLLIRSKKVNDGDE